MKEKFAGDKKVGDSILGKAERVFKAWGLPKIPTWLETYHLTMLTLVWSGLNLLWGHLAKVQNNFHWLWLVSLMIVLQYITDLFDGAVGRARDTGLVKWGYFMDHFLDYIFLCSLVTAGFLIAPAGLHFWYMILLIIVGGFMVSSFLGFAATNEFQIYYYGMGPTEMRIVFIVINTVIIFTGTGHFTCSVPILVGVCFVGLCINVFFAQKKLWAVDMEEKNSK
ncbi:CDP-alcohol phosphatidyltransferase family protein [Planctomycetota bacterium]